MLHLNMSTDIDMELNSSDSSVVSSDDEEVMTSEQPVRLLIKEKSKNNI